MGFPKPKDSLEAEQQQLSKDLADVCAGLSYQAQMWPMIARLKDICDENNIKRSTFFVETVKGLANMLGIKSEEVKH